MKRLFLILFFAILISGAWAQINIVPNPSFDQTITSCPTGLAQWDKCDNWNNVNMNVGAGSNWGTPDYYQTCGTGGTAPPATASGTCSPHSGSGMMGLVLYNVGFPSYREYISTQLNCTMLPGFTYTVSFWVTNGTGLLNPYTIKNIGIHFSSAPLTQTGWGCITSVTPQCEIQTNVASTSWVQYTFAVTPTVACNYLTLGSFRPDSQNGVTPTYTNNNIWVLQSNYANYFFDDIKVLKPFMTFSLTPTISQPTCNTVASATVTPSIPNISLTYSWTPGNYTTTSVSGLSSGFYNVFAYNTNTCINSGTVGTSFQINPPITAPILTVTSSPASVCAGKSVTLHALGSSNYTWQPSSVVGDSIVFPVLFTQTITVYSTFTNGCVSTGTVSVTALPLPTLNISSSPTVLCSGNSATITASGASTYTWLPGGNSNPIIVSPNTNTTYSVTGTGTNGCKSSSTLNLNVIPTPTLNISSSNTLICQGSAATLTASGASNYTWLPGNSNTNINVVTPQASGIFTVMGTNTNVCVGTNTISISVLPTPTVLISAPSLVICPGISNTLIASGATNYTWQPVNSTNSVIVTTPTTTTTYTVYATGSNTCVTASTITLNPGTLINLGVSNYTFCNNASTGVSVTATSTFTAGPITYSWMPGSMAGQTVFVSPPASSSYTLYASSPNGCPNSATLSVSVVTNCCSQSTTGLTPLTAITGTYTNNSYFLANSCTLTNTSAFNNSEVLMMPNVNITIPQGMVLNLDHTHLYACGIKMWQGIVVQDGGQITSSYNPTSGSSMIEDALTGIEVNGITSAGANPPILISNLIFNKNYIGITLSNSQPTITSIPLGISECVFSSRQISFASPGPFNNTSWPNSSNTTGGLRFPVSPTATQGLFAPYLLTGFQTNLKLPYSNQPGHIGIKIQNVGQQSGAPPTNGVDIGVVYPNGNGMFNLFDGLGVGIEVEDASLTTINNVFQNAQRYQVGSNWFGGYGIKQNISGLMNARLNLSPTSFSTSCGNLFWDCMTSVRADNAYDVNIEYGTYRSSHNSNPSAMIGDTAIMLQSNRFNYNIQNCQFNNIANSIITNATIGTYALPSGTVSGTYANNIDIEENYFGPEVASNVTQLPGMEYSGDAISVLGNGGSNWQLMGACKIASNKIDRSFRGIRASNMVNYPTVIGGNNIQIVTDYIQTTASQYGIYVNGSQDYLTIEDNNVAGDGGNPLNTRIRLINSVNNTTLSSVSPIVTCNRVSDAYIGFEFDGPQPGTVWTNNQMFQKMFIGLSLVNNGIIGTQGSAGTSCGNYWYDVLPDLWSTNWNTYVDNSSSAASGSFLWCMNMQNSFPVNNGGANPFSTVLNPSTLGYSSNIPGDCISSYPSGPSQRMMQQTKSKDISSSDIRIFPNPSNDKVIVSSSKAIQYVRVTDLSGKVVLEKSALSGEENSLDVSSLKPSVYIIEVHLSENKTIREKLIKAN
ncbi:MAG: T9SS type A sorting domain-containing protein [Bacteroidetes bacterium]|nr:T9SS type A sorting domain-containing protein [Bacteroidota bacterium]